MKQENALVPAHPLRICASAHGPLALGVLIVLAFSCSTSARIGQEAGKPAEESKETTLIKPYQTIDRGISGGQSHSYELTLQAGQYANLAVDQRGIDLKIDLFDASGKVSIEFDAQKKRQGEEKVELVADAETTFRLAVVPVYPGAAQGRYQLKVDEIRQANQTDKSLFETRRLSTKADLLFDKGNFDEAIEVSNQALERAEKTADDEQLLLANSLLRLGRLFRVKAEVNKAEGFMQRAVDLYRKALGEEDPQTARAIGNQGLIFDSRFEYASAASYYQKAIDITDRTLGPDDPQSALFLMDLAIAFAKRGNFENVVPMYQRALAISEKMMGPDDPLTMKICYNWGDAYLDMNRHDDSEPLMKRALGIVERTYGPDHPNAAYPLQNLGIIARRHHQYDLALEYLWRSEKIREKSLGPRNPQTATLLVNIGNVYHAEENYPKAIELFLQALDILETTTGPYNLSTILTLSNLTRTYAAEGDASRSGDYQVRLDQAVEKNIAYNLVLGSEKEKLDYLENISSYTDRSISTNVRQLPGDRRSTENAATALLQRKGRVLDSLALSISSLRQHLKPEDQELLNQLGTATTELAKLSLSGPKKMPIADYQQRLHSLEAEREKLEGEVSRRSKGYYESANAVTLESVRNAIPADSVLIEYAVYAPFNPKAPNDPAGTEDPHYVSYVIPGRGEIHWADLGRADQIDAAVEKLREALSDPSRDDASRLSRALDQKIMEPVRALVGDARHLLVSPDGALNLIPFEALVDARQHFLIERYSITYLTTGRDLLRLQVERKSQTGPMVVANPLFGEPAPDVLAHLEAPRPDPNNAGQRRRSITTALDLSRVYFAPLPGTAREARAIQTLFPLAEILTGTRATKSRVEKMNAPSILHIATHSFFLQDPAEDSARKTEKPARRDSGSLPPTRAENPLLRSGVALTGANLTKSTTAEGLLTGLEAAGLDLWGTKLVTLSACETGVGKIRNGEGVYGLRRAFFLAGTETLVMSLWEVSDRVTQEMMSSYYSGLKQGLGRGQALRQTQLSMLKRKERRHPFYWAGFIQAGEWANLDGKR